MKPRDVERQFFTCEQWVERQERRVLASYCDSKIQSEKNHGDHLGMHQYQLQNPPEEAHALYMVWSAWCNILWAVTKPSQEISTENNWCVWVEHREKNVHNMPKDMIKLFYSTTMLEYASALPILWRYQKMGRFMYRIERRGALSLEFVCCHKDGKK